MYRVHRKIDEVSKLIKKQRFEEAIHVEISSLADDIIFSELRMVMIYTFLPRI